jgi:hypothetical protein
MLLLALQTDSSANTGLLKAQCTTFVRTHFIFYEFLILICSTSCGYDHAWTHTDTFTYHFSHLADALIQRDLHCLALICCCL